MSAAGTEQVGPGRYRVALRFSDIDELGHVNQAVYHELLEEARTQMLFALPVPPGGSYVMARVELNHRREVRLQHRYVEVALQIEAVGRSSITMAQQIFRADGELAADGRAVVVAWDGEQRGSRPLTGPETAALRALPAS